MRNIAIFISTLFLSVTSIYAQLQLPALVRDSMILQRDAPINIWGWELEGKEVEIVFNKVTYKAKPDLNKKWSLSIKATKAGGPYTMLISTKSAKLEIKEILVGDVWLCSGQSNMEMQMFKLASKYGDDIANSTNQFIREFHVKEAYSFAPKTTTEGSWKMANPTNVRFFTAAGYYMARYLYNKYKVPIGIIHSSWGGTVAEAWTSEEGLKDFEVFVKRANYFKDENNVKTTLEKDKLTRNNWYDDINKRDIGLQENGAAKWVDLDVDTADWATMNAPGFFEGNKDKKIACGVIWVRKEIVLTKEMTSSNALLELGLIDDNDYTYFNGKLVGQTKSKYPVRSYAVPASLLKEGKNIIAIRIINTDGDAGFAKGKNYRFLAGTKVIELSGEWKVKVGIAAKNLDLASFTNLQNQPTGLFNSMINPLIPYTIKGVAWYQGEGNAGRGKEYYKLLPAMISDWRKRWGQGNFPFLIVQLANFGEPNKKPAEGGLAVIRESQLKISQEIPNCGLAVTIDIGEAYDVHYINKKDVGIRLALAAQQIAYNEKKIIGSGPIYQSMEVVGNKLVLSFTNLGSGLLAKDSDLNQFTIAGSDKKFVWAQAKIENNKLIVWSDKIEVPTAVRYAWASNPIGSNLYNLEGLPASPFRTDNW